MADKWTIELTSDQVQELLEAAEDARNQLEYYPPRPDHELHVHEAHKRSTRLIKEVIEILLAVQLQICNEAGVPE